MGFGRLCLALLALATATATADAKLECRKPNYVTRDGRIFAQDPEAPTTETEINIRGVAWGGMEKENMIPDGLFGVNSVSGRGVQGTKISTLMTFLTNNSINSVKLPLSAQYILSNAPPQLAYIHGWDNKELTAGWADPNAVTYFDLIGRLVQTLQTHKLSVVLDIRLLSDYPQDAYWYTAPYIEIEQSPTYKSVEFLAKAFCNSTYWNVLGVDLKDEMSDVQWNVEAGDKKTDWHAAATILANRVLELCPSWLVFVGGASSPTPAQQFTVSDAYVKAPSDHWAGGNLHNATAQPLNTTLAHKIVLSPHAYAHGKLPQNYFYAASSVCTKTSPADEYVFENEQLDAECVDIINGAKKRSKIPCSSTEFGCSSYKHLTTAEIAANYKKVMDEAVGAVLKDAQTPVIFGGFGGVYGKEFQPHQTAALDFLIEFAATKLRGGYFWALNPDTEYFLEDSTNAGSGLFGKTHYGLFKMTSWQEPNADLLAALSTIPTSAIPCYGGKSESETTSSDGFSIHATGLVTTAVVVLLNVFYTLQ